MRRPVVRPRGSPNLAAHSGLRRGIGRGWIAAVAPVIPANPSPIGPPVMVVTHRWNRKQHSTNPTENAPLQVPFGSIATHFRCARGVRFSSDSDRIAAPR